MFDIHEEPLLVGGFDFNKGTYDSRTLVIEEYVEGVISGLSIEVANELLKEIAQKIKQDDYEKLKREERPVFYLVLNCDNNELFICLDENLGKEVSDERLEHELLCVVANDLS